MREQRHHSWWVLAGILVVFVGGSKAVHWWSQAQAASTVRAHVKPGDITMFSTVDCIYCARARDWMAANQIPWTECDVERNAMCRETYAAKGAPGTPLMRVKGRWNLGFDAEWLSQAIQ